MRIRISIGAIAFACILASSLRAGVNAGDHPELRFKDAMGNGQVDLQALAGKLVVVDFWASWCGPCMEEAPHVVAVNQKYAARGLQMIGVSLDADPSAMQAVVKEKGFTWPQYFDGLGWDNRIAKAWGVDSIPQTFIISPTGDVLWRGHPAEIDAPLKKAMREHPPQLVDPQTAAAAKQTLEKVEAATASAHFADAIKLLGQFPADARADPKIAAREDKDTHRLQAAADAVLANTDTLVAQKHYTEAATALKALVDSMAGTDEGKKAQESLNNLRANPAAAAALAAAAREDSANSVLQTAQKLQAAKRDRQAYISYKSVVKQFPGTAAAATAALAIKAYDADPAFAKEQAAADAADRSAKAHSALNLAMNYLNAGQTDTAREKFQDVIDRFPGTPEAEAAKDELAKLSG